MNISVTRFQTFGCCTDRHRSVLSNDSARDFLASMQAGSWSQTLQSAVSNLIDNHGITVVVATGNAQVDACQITPANVNGTLAVAGSDMSSKFGTSQNNSDILYEYDNTGSCVDVFAPGVDIMAACGGAGEHACTCRADAMSLQQHLTELY